MRSPRRTSATRVELEERIGSRPWLARTRYWYGRFLLDAGDVDAATPLLEDARRRCERPRYGGTGNGHRRPRAVGREATYSSAKS